MKIITEIKKTCCFNRFAFTIAKSKNSRPKNKMCH